MRTRLVPLLALLALGVVPVGARAFQGGIDVTSRPWAQEALHGSTPKTIGAEELDGARDSGDVTLLTVGR